MTPERWRQIKDIAGEALERPESERVAFVDEACGGDEPLRREVTSLLRSAARAVTYLEAPAARPPIPQSGARIGSWRILNELGHGGMGVVYLAERVDSSFHQRAAVKLVRGSLPSPLLHQRFLYERQILATLEHPNIARLIDGGTTDDGMPYVAIEYVEGMPIDRYCESGGLSITERLELFRQVCLAVHYAHQRLIVHRDIKASNILVGSDGVPKLLDFGIAKLIDPARETDRTRTILRMVTPESASPEQLKGGAITTATDVYGLGVLLYRLLTGTGPYRLQSGTESELVQAICDQAPVPASQAARRVRADATTAMIRGDISPELDHVIGKALRKEPERRYATAEELGEDLRRFLMRLPVTAMPDSWSYRARKAIARNRVAAIAVSVVLIVLVAGVVATAWQARVAARERNRAQHQFDAVRTLASSVLWELREAVEKLPGSAAAQELLLTRATEYLDRLAAEAGDDLTLRRELANGYERLGQVRGASGLPNLGDVKAAQTAYRKSNALLESISPEQVVDADRLKLANNYLRLRTMQRDDSLERSALLEKARTLIESRREASDVSWHGVTQLLWDEIATDQIAKKNYKEARVSVTNALRAAEAAHNLHSNTIDRSRNLSLACKRLGAVLQVLNEHDEALTYYNRALALDLARVERDPTRGLWRLDLSFSYASISGVQAQQGDMASAIASYEKALELRRGVVAANPDDDFARASLGRGYGRIAGLMGEAGDVTGAIDSRVRGLEVYRQRAAAHPDRENLWQEYEDAALASLGASLDLAEAEKTSRQDRVAVIPKIRTMLAALAGARKQQAARKPDAAASSVDAELEKLERRLNALTARS